MKEDFKKELDEEVRRWADQLQTEARNRPPVEERRPVITVESFNYTELMPEEPPTEIYQS